MVPDSPGTFGTTPGKHGVTDSTLERKRCPFRMRLSGLCHERLVVLPARTGRKTPHNKGIPRAHLNLGSAAEDAAKPQD